MEEGTSIASESLPTPDARVLARVDPSLLAAGASVLDTLVAFRMFLARAGSLVVGAFRFRRVLVDLVFLSAGEPAIELSPVI